MREDNAQKRGFRGLLGRSLQDLIAILLPAMAVTTAFAIGACFIYDREMEFLLYSALPENCKNWLLFCVCWAEEMRMLFIAVGIAVPTMQLQVIAFDLLNVSLEAIGKCFMG